MKIKIVIGSVIIIIISTGTYLGFNKFNHSLNENEALNLLTDTITRDSLYASFTTLQCLDFYANETTQEYFVFTIREIHGNGCEGDPNSRPRVDTIKIMRRTKNIFYYDVLKDSYFPYDISKLKR